MFTEPNPLGNLSFDPLREEEVSSAWRLSTQAGWNQSEEDWRRLCRLPEVRVEVLWQGGEVRASYAVAFYGADLAWIGMVLVDEACRGAGLGKAVLRRALEVAKGSDLVGLDATDLGEPIYLRSGFRSIAPIGRWAGLASPEASGGTGIREGFHEGILNLDRDLAGCDRSGLLRDLAGFDGRFFRWESEGHLEAFAVLRPGRKAWHAGPIVARSALGFATVFDALLAACAGEEVICDVLAAEAAAAHLRQRGFQPRRELKRMTLPQQAGCLCGPGIWCGAGFEWG